MDLFQSTLLMRGATAIMIAAILHLCISIHAPHARSDLIDELHAVKDKFQSTLLMRGATRLLFGSRPPSTFQSTLLMRGATPSISSLYSLMRYFNPRSSCEERPSGYQESQRQMLFQSTLLMRGATTRVCTSSSRKRYFNPRSSCEERLAYSVKRSRSPFDFNPRSSCKERRRACYRASGKGNFNPRSSCEERRSRIMIFFSMPRFQSTLLMRGATHPAIG